MLGIRLKRGDEVRTADERTFHGYGIQQGAGLDFSHQRLGVVLRFEAEGECDGWFGCFLVLTCPEEGGAQEEIDDKQTFVFHSLIKMRLRLLAAFSVFLE